jgi:hypothetical protein
MAATAVSSMDGSVGCFAGAMIVPLEVQELVDGCKNRWIPGDEAQLPAARQRVNQVLNASATGSHHRGPRYFTVVHEAGQIKVGPPEGLGDPSHVTPDPRHAG